MFFPTTGDNMLTALSVARECLFVEENEPIILVQAFPRQYDAKGNVIEHSHVDFVYTEHQEKTTNGVKDFASLEKVIHGYG